MAAGILPQRDRQAGRVQQAEVFADLGGRIAAAAAVGMAVMIRQTGVAASAAARYRAEPLSIAAMASAAAYRTSRS